MNIVEPIAGAIRDDGLVASVLLRCVQGLVCCCNQFVKAVGVQARFGDPEA
jgi:hypothetical protein